MVQPSSDKIGKFWRAKVQHGDYSYQYCIVHLKIAKKVNVKDFS